MIDLKKISKLTFEDVSKSVSEIDDPNFNWLGLATHAQFMTSLEPKRNQVGWAKIAIESWSKYKQILGDDICFDPNSELLMRANLVKNEVSAEEFSYSELCRVLAEAIESLDTPTLRLRFEKTRSQKIEDIRRLRRIKNLLNSVEHLLEGDVDYELVGDSSWWYERRNRLP